MGRPLPTAEWEIGAVPRDFTDPAVLLDAVKALAEDQGFGLRWAHVVDRDGTYAWESEARWQLRSGGPHRDEDLGTAGALALHAAIGGVPDA